MKKVEQFAVQAFVQAIQEAYGLSIRTSVLVESLPGQDDKSAEVNCFVTCEGQFFEGVFHGEEDGGEIRMEGRSFWFEARADGTPIAAETLMSPA